MDQKQERGPQTSRWQRFAIVRLLLYVAAIAACVVVATLVSRLLVPPAPSPWHSLVWIKNLLLPPALFFLYAGMVRKLEGRSADEIGVRQGTRLFLPGLMVGAGIIGASFLILWSSGMVTLEGGTGLAGLAAAILVPLVTAMGEELIFRAIIFGTLEEIFGSLVAIILSALLFGLAHLANPGATPFTIMALSVELGGMLAMAYILTRNIWYPVAIHAAWNFTEAFIFGAYNSGVRDPSSLLRTELVGPDIVTGGTFGPEGSVVTLVLSLLVSSVFYLRIRKGNNWRPMRARKRSFQP